MWPQGSRLKTQAQDSRLKTQGSCLSKVALEGAVDSLGLAAQNRSCVVFGDSQGVATVHPVVAWLVFMDLATGGWGPPRALLHICNTCELIKT